jgi:hypothetical protein
MWATAALAQGGEQGPPASQEAPPADLVPLASAEEEAPAEEADADAEEEAPAVEEAEASPAPPPTSHGMRFHVMSETIGDAYQLVRSDNEVLNRRRIHQYLGLGAYDLLGDGEGQLSFVSLMRFDADFGITEDELDSVDGLRRDQLSLQTLYLEGHDLWGMIDLKLGRQLHYDTIDFLMLDGLNLTVKLPWHLAVEVLAGMEADNDVSGFTSSQFEIDGTRVIESDDALDVDVAKMVVGGALVTHGFTRVRGRLGYRRIFSDGQVNQEKLGAAITSRPLDNLQVDAAASYDFFNDYLDTVRAGTRIRIGDAVETEIQYVRLLPSFDADSIFNIFTAEPLNDVNGRVRYYMNRTSWVHVGGMVRLFGADTINKDDVEIDGADGTVKATGLMIGWWHRYGSRGRVSFDASHESGYGGDRTLIDLDGRYALFPGEIELDGRITGVLFQDELQGNLGGAGGGYQLGVRYLVDERATLQIMVEQNFNAIHTNQFRVFVVADLDLWM